MIKRLSLLSLLLGLFMFGSAQEILKENSELATDTVSNKEEVKKKKEKSSFHVNRIFYGGSLGFSFGSVTTVRLNPLIGYRILPKLSAGLTALYEYTGYQNAYYGKQNYNNYGASVFARYLIIPQIYAHAEFNYTSFQFSGGFNGSYRVGVPFMLLGGGFAQRIGGNTYAYGQVLFDVLQDKNSPYAWDPFYSFGISVGF